MLGPIDVLVNNAGIAITQSALKQTKREWEKVQLFGLRMSLFPTRKRSQQQGRDRDREISVIFSYLCAASCLVDLFCESVRVFVCSRVCLLIDRSPAPPLSPSPFLSLSSLLCDLWSPPSATCVVRPHLTLVCFGGVDPSHPVSVNVFVSRRSLPVCMSVSSSVFPSPLSFPLLPSAPSLSPSLSFPRPSLFILLSDTRGGTEHVNTFMHRYWIRTWWVRSWWHRPSPEAWYGTSEEEA